ncbi:hypothetical protein NEOLI_002374 [Neolecta irregularis DAH-3]|uniref:Uncharacterized protein n=1 Tax=Neolecta irregularis (strain DAH-3) TaxID=1198029 RepID=A0A1U7LPP1_NEOID|nr:hypothetical protein NEOLI_002374 [Neolecta irregularis DAH-3]|eukprot:OLL24512.1 hypothetical protein NEOLI_002374 [Neolecta irregularis DAH-3]
MALTDIIDLHVPNRQKLFTSTSTDNIPSSCTNISWFCVMSYSLADIIIQFGRVSQTFHSCVLLYLQNRDPSPKELVNWPFSISCTTTARPHADHQVFYQRACKFVENGFPLPADLSSDLIAAIPTFSDKLQTSAYTVLIEGNSHRQAFLDRIYEQAKFKSRLKHIRLILTLIAERQVLIGNPELGVDMFLEERGINGHLPEILEILYRRKRMDLAQKIVARKDVGLHRYIEELAKMDYLSAEGLSRDLRFRDFPPLKLLQSARNETDLLRYWNSWSPARKRHYGKSMIAVWGKLHPEQFFEIFSQRSFSDKSSILKEFSLGKPEHVVLLEIFQLVVTWRRLIEGYLSQNNISRAEVAMSTAFGQIPDSQRDALFELYEPFLEYYYEQRDYFALKSTVDKVITHLSRKRFAYCKHLIWICWEENMKAEAKEIVSTMKEATDQPAWQERTMLFALDALTPPKDWKKNELRTNEDLGCVRLPPETES